MTLVAGIVAWVALSALVTLYAHNRGRNPVLAAVTALVLSPIFGFLLIAALRDRVAERRHAELLAAIRGEAAPPDDVRTRASDAARHVDPLVVVVALIVMGVLIVGAVGQLGSSANTTFEAVSSAM